jgi:hypothetical protein
MQHPFAPQQATPTPPFVWRHGATNTPGPGTALDDYNDSSNINFRVRININWSRVDTIDAIIDVAGIAGDITSFFEPEGSIPYVLSEIAEGAGFIKSVVDVFSGDSSNILLQQTTSSAEEAIVLVARAERLVPVVGFAGNIVSLYMKLKTEVSITIGP